MIAKSMKKKNVTLLKRIAFKVKTASGLSMIILIPLEGSFLIASLSHVFLYRLDGLNLKDMGAESENTEEEHNDVAEQKEQHETRTWGQVDVSLSRYNVILNIRKKKTKTFKLQPKWLPIKRHKRGRPFSFHLPFATRLIHLYLV